mmetsp:Transcript_23013/g.52708  ORF Transcript_23013/g.52708 Transcript_23013/m.52708 type:complete len:335 (-) Transcript_23013:174-1178(-)
MPLVDGAAGMVRSPVLPPAGGERPLGRHAPLRQQPRCPTDQRHLEVSPHTGLLAGLGPLRSWPAGGHGTVLAWTFGELGRKGLQRHRDPRCSGCRTPAERVLAVGLGCGPASCQRWCLAFRPSAVAGEHEADGHQLSVLRCPRTSTISLAVDLRLSWDRLRPVGHLPPASTATSGCLRHIHRDGPCQAAVHAGLVDGLPLLPLHLRVPVLVLPAGHVRVLRDHNGSGLLRDTDPRAVRLLVPRRSVGPAALREVRPGVAVEAPARGQRDGRVSIPGEGRGHRAAPGPDHDGAVPLLQQGHLRCSVGSVAFQPGLHARHRLHQVCRVQPSLRRQT